jgi:glycosyltransferase 2 family protein
MATGIKWEKKRVLQILFIVIFTIAIFYFFFTKISLSSVVEILFTADPLAISLSLLIMAILAGISGKRWQIILDAMNYNMSYKSCLTTIMASVPFSIITPAKAGDAIRAYFLKDKIPMTRTIGGVLSERLIDLSVLLIFVIISLVFYRSVDILFLLLLVFVGGIVFIIIISQSDSFPLKESWREKIQNLLLSLKSLVKTPKDFIRIIFLSILFWLLTIIQVSLFFTAVGIDVPFLFIMGNIPIAILIGMIPVSLGGMGTRDAAIILLFSSYALPDQLLSVGILFSLIRYWIPGLIGLLFINHMPVLTTGCLKNDE